MIATIFIDTVIERLFPLSGNTHKAVTEFVKSQIDLSFVFMCTPATIHHLHPGLTPEQTERMLSELLIIPSERRDNIAPYEVCIDEIYLNLRSKKSFILSGWPAIFRRENLPAEYNGKKVVHSFSAMIEKEFLQVCQAVLQPPPVKKEFPDDLKI